MSSAAPTHTNRLAQETSPYLLQHAHNPVDWYPWGEDAFRAAREQSKPIFLSVGYSTCYWCHVMERQCFENESIAQLMNERYINIKVDREERPDVDQLYMTAVQVMTRQGGWPMSVFLTPTLRPFFGGTYFPPEDMSDGRGGGGGGRPGFPRVLTGLSDAWQTRRDEVEQSADQLLAVLHQLATPRPPEADITFDAGAFDAYITHCVSDYEPTHGGFGRAPKFPRQTLLKLLLTYIDGPARRNPQLTRKVRDMLRHTLDAMDRGGIHDHLAGGFHRYSTDARWLVPHFEIMLYDQAMLADVYATTARIFSDDDGNPHPRWAGVARGICDFVLREMTSPQGAFYTAFDAEVDHYEGQNYLWTKAEIESILSPEDAALFNCVYGVDQGPNFADPHASSGVGGGGGPDRNILFLDRTLEQACHEHGLSFDELTSRLVAMRAKLKSVRDQRKQPLLDTKILTGWNALMASALATCGTVLSEPRYTAAAIANCRFLLSHHRMPDGGLYRTSKENAQPKFPAFLDDYAALAHACLATGDDSLRTEAAHLTDQLLARFGAGACHEKEEGGSKGNCAGCGSGGLFFTDASADDLIVRQKVATDSPLPSGNALALDVLRQLGQTPRAIAILREFAQTIEDNAEATTGLLEAAMRLVRSQEDPTLTVEASPQGRANAAARAASDDTEANAATPQPGTSPQELAHRAVNIEGQFTSPTELLIRLTIAPGYHLAAARTLTSIPHEGAQPTEITFPDAIVTYPDPQRVQLPLAPEPIDIYQGQIVLSIRFNIPPSGTIQGSLRYQPCTDDACLPLVVQPMELRVG
jgi:uncharacterized protein YyaL (SSP411 family)